MTPQEKAEELVDSMYLIDSKKVGYISKKYSIQFAKKTAEEIMRDLDAEDNYIKYNYWQEVLNCLNKM